MFAVTLGDEAFGRADKTLQKIIAAFAVYHFEAFTIGLQSILASVNVDDAGHVSKLRDAFLQIKKDPAFVALTTGGGKNSPGPLKARIKFVADRLVDVL